LFPAKLCDILNTNLNVADTLRQGKKQQQQQQQTRKRHYHTTTNNNNNKTMKVKANQLNSFIAKK